MWRPDRASAMQRRRSARRWASAAALGLLLGLGTAPAATAAASTEPLLRIEAGHHAGAIRRVAVSPDQTLLATVSDDKTARLWQIADRRLLATLRWSIGDGDLGRMYGVAFSPDGREIVVGGTSGDAAGGHHLQVYSAVNGEPRRRVELDAGHVVRLLWTQSGRHLAACLAGTHGVRIVAADGGGRPFADAFDAPCFGLAELPDGSLLASGYDGRLRQYRERDGAWRLERSVRTGVGDPRSIAVSPDGRHVAVGYNSRHADGQAVVDVLDAGTLGLARRFAYSDLARDAAGLGSVAWSRDGRTIAAAGRAAENSGYKTRMVVKRIAWPAGTVRSDFVATDTVQDLAPWDTGDFIVATGLGSWSTLSAAGSVTPLGSTVNDLRGPDNLAIDATARTVAFGAEGWSGARRYSLPRRELAPGTGAQTQGPRRMSFSLSLADWQDRLQPQVGGRVQPMEPGEVSRAAALLPDAAAAVLGTSRTVRLVGRDGRTVWSVRTASEVTAVHASQDGRLIVGTLLDGTVRWWRASDGRLLLTLFVSIDDRWVLWTDDGYYDASPGGETLAGWHVNRGDGRAEFHSIGRFRDRYFRPDVIDRVLDTLDARLALDAADRERSAYAAVVPPPAEDPGAPQAAVAEPVAQRLPPVLRVFTDRAVHAQARELRIAFAVESSAQAVDAIQLRIDGQPVESAQVQLPRRQDGQDQGQIVVPMPERSASVMLIARAGSLASEPVFVAWHWRPPESKTASLQGLPPAPERLAAAAIAGLTLPSPSALVGSAPQAAIPTVAPPPSRRPRVYVVAVGVSEYQDTQLKLEFPAKDASDFAQFMQAQQGRMYSTVEVRLVTDRQATRAKVLEALDWLKSKVGAADTGMVFIAGHGINDARGHYHFLAHDADPRNLARTAISEAEIRARLSSLWGRALLFVDTCHAGNVLGTHQAMNSEMRRLANTLSSPENGVIVFSASTGRQTAIEYAPWGNGAFTKALLEGLKGGADYRKDGVVTHQGLSYFLGREVSKLTGGRQVPVTAVPVGMVDFALAAL